MASDSTKAPELSESEYLIRQAEEAKEAAAKAFANAKALLGNAIDPREAAKSHPFIAISSAALAGFVAAVVAIPSKRQQEQRRLDKLYEALHPKPVEPSKNPDGKPVAAPVPIWMSLLKEAIAIARPLLVTAVTAGLNAQANQEKKPSEDGTKVPADAGSI